MVTPNGQFIQVNRAFCDFLGYSEPELVGQTVLSITHPEDREASSTAIRQASESGPRIQRLEKRYLHKSGQVLWGEVSSTLICDAEGKPSYFIAQVLDISERKQAEEALKKAHDELEADESRNAPPNCERRTNDFNKATMSLEPSTTGWLTVFLSRTSRHCDLFGRMRQSAGCSATRKRSCGPCRSGTFTPPRHFRTSWNVFVR